MTRDVGSLRRGDRRKERARRNGGRSKFLRRGSGVVAADGGGSGIGAMHDAVAQGAVFGPGCIMRAIRRGREGFAYLVGKPGGGCLQRGGDGFGDRKPGEVLGE